MKKLYTLIIVTVLSVSCSKNNDYDLENVIKLSSQEEVNQLDVSNLVQIDLLEISGSDINDLSHLNTLTNVKRLQINNNPKLTNLHGLQNSLNFITSLSITNNRSLSNYTAINNLYIENPKISFKTQNNLFNPKKETLENIYVLQANIYSGDILINNKNDFNNLIAQKYTRIDGNFTINSTNITSLIGLESLSIINGEFKIDETAILNAEGLENIKTIEDGLIISDNSSLRNLQGLNSLSTSKGLSILNNDNLTNLEGLDNLRSLPGSWTDGKFNSTVKGGLVIENNPSLESLTGLQRLFLSSTRIWIKNNPLLQSLSALSNFSSQNVENIDISSNNSLINLTGLEKIMYTSDLTISNNSNLKSLDGLEGIERINDSFSVTNNINLVDFCSLNESYISFFNRTILYNGYNPTRDQINSLDYCKQP